MLGFRAVLVVALVLAGCSEATTTPAAGQATLVAGVVPYAIDDAFCPQGPARESAFFDMDDENDTHCSYETGDLREGRWVSPHASKWEIPGTCEFGRTRTMLRFCRSVVPEAAFRPLTTDPDASEHFYAILKFGERCPAHAVEITKRIVNEDTGNRNDPTRAGELLAPNEIVDDARGNYTKLVFCFFRAAPSPAESMESFPELGFPYAVFHDFDAAQPSWVIRKRWQYSDDSNQSSPTNTYEADAVAGEATREFQRIVENPERDGTYDTYFEMARVR
jgi:hypothetical protein